jgi:formylglycine-generating enzyme required for sulfatase activity
MSSTTLNVVHQSNISDSKFEISTLQVTIADSLGCMAGEIYSQQPIWCSTQRSGSLVNSSDHFHQMIDLIHRVVERKRRANRGFHAKSSQ